MRAYSFMLFYICVSISAYILVQSGIIAAGNELYASPSGISSNFAIANIGAVVAGFGVTAGISGILAFFTRQYVLAAGALLIYVVGVLFEPINWFVNGVPIMLGAFGAPAYLVYAIEAFTSFIFFFFLLDILAGRQTT